MSHCEAADAVRRIRLCLNSVAELVRSMDLTNVSVDFSCNGDPTTTLDRAINRTILETLPRPGEGWLSEESEDQPDRLASSLVWIVDPIDGTREFLENVPEWCVSIALAEEGEIVAGGVLNPITGQMFLGSPATGLEVLGPGNAARCDPGPCLLVSRREHRQGKWAAFEKPGLAVLPVGSIAYRLALVAAGQADATCTFEPRSEWDVAAGIALIRAAGGVAHVSDGCPIVFNQAVPRLPNLFAFGRNCSASFEGIERPRMHT